MKKGAFLFLSLLLCFGVPCVRAESSLLKIRALPDQNSARPGMMFLVHVRVENTASDASAGFWSNSCSYEKHWVTDNPAVLIQSWTCDENVLEEVELEGGEAYEKDIILYIPEKDETGPVTFRLGFKQMSENGDVAEPLWSDPVTMNVEVSGDMKPSGAEAEESSSEDDPLADELPPAGNSTR